MKRNSILAVLLLSLIPAIAWAGVVADTHFNSLTEGGWTCFGTGSNPEGGGAGSAAIATAPGSAPDPSKALQVSFPSGWHDGYNPAECDSDTFNSREVYGQMYVYFPSGYQFHTTANKLTYVYLDSKNYTDNPGNFYVAVWGSARYMAIHLQPSSSGVPGGNRVLYENQGHPSAIQTGSWFKISWYMRLNDSGSANGVARLWVNDVLQLEYTDVELRGGSYGSRNFWLSTLLPIWGGYNADNPTKDRSDSFFYDRAILSTTPFGGGSVSIPAPPTALTINK